MDNISSDVSQEIDNNSVDAQQTPVSDSVLSQSQNTVSIPDKFLVNGEPDYNKLTQSYLELEKRIGTKVPVSDSAEYDFKFQAEDLWDTEQYEAFKGTAAELGLSKDQFNAAMQLYEQNMTEVISQLTETPEKCSEELQQSWGKEYDTNLKSAFNAFQAYAPEGLNIDDIGNNPKVIKLLANIGKQMGEDPGINTQSTTRGTSMSKLEIQELQSRPDYWTNREVQNIVSKWYADTYR